MGLGSFFKDHVLKNLPVVGTALDIASGVGSLIHGNKQQGRADKLQNRSLDFAQQRWDSGAPLRSLGMSRLQNTQRPDLTNIYRNAQNPFSTDAARPPQGPAGPLPSLGGGPDMGQPPIGPQGAPQGLPPMEQVRRLRSIGRI